MNLLNFVSQYPDEASCKAKFKEFRDKQGVVCHNRYEPIWNLVHKLRQIMGKKVLVWVHIAISNAKRMLLDIFHDIKPEYLQNYLNEFCYKFNRRYFGENLFDRLMIAAVSYKNQFGINNG